MTEASMNVLIQEKKFIVFDFDGVVCDSTDECMVTSWNAWEQWEGRNGFRRGVEEFGDSEIRNFRSLRPYVKGAGEYYIVRRLLSEGKMVKDQTQYDFYVEKWREWASSFKEIFFNCRELLRKENLTAWIDLHPVYDDVILLMKDLNLQQRLFIATLKDGESVKLILNHHGVNLDEGRLLDQSMIKSKLQALDIIREMLKCSQTDLLFVDDNLTHLIAPHNAGYHVYLTTWGNVLAEFIKSSQHLSLPTITINDLRVLIK